MIGLSGPAGRQRNRIRKEPFLFVEPDRLEQEYPIPSAFAAYVDFSKEKEMIGGRYENFICGNSLLQF